MTALGVSIALQGLVRAAAWAQGCDWPAQIAPSAEQASAKCVGTCSEFSVEEAFPRALAAAADAGAASASSSAPAGKEGASAAAAAPGSSAADLAVSLSGTPACACCVLLNVGS